MEMFKKLLDSMKAMLASTGKKKLIENTLIVVVLGVIIIIAGGAFFGKSNNKADENAQKTSVETINKTFASEEKTELEVKLETILSQISGVGKASVMITYVSGEETIPAYNTKKNETDTQEKDSGGGTRNTRQSDYENSIAYIEEQGGGKKPIVLKDLQPTVKGVVVVADGAGDPTVRENICKAVEALMDIPIHKVQIFQREK